MVTTTTEQINGHSKCFQFQGVLMENELETAHSTLSEIRYKLLYGNDLLNAPPMSWIVQGIIPTKGLAALYGKSGSGKSFLALDMGLAVSSGISHWFGYRITQVPVTYICLEGEAGIGKRINAWGLHFKKSLPKNMRFIMQSFNLLSPDDVTEMAKAIVSADSTDGLLIIDTLNRASPGVDENSSKDMGRIIAACEKLQKLIGGLVLLVHHCGKNEKKGLRGHSSLHAALDAEIEVVKMANHHKWNTAKSKDDETGNSHQFKLEISNIGVDHMGEKITSCVILQDGSIKEKISYFPPLKGKNMKIIFEALNNILRSSNCFGQAGAPKDKPCISLTDAIKKTKDYLALEPKRQVERTKEAIFGLVGNGLLNHQDGWLWMV